MPIESIDHPPEERARRRADLLAQSRRETLRTITLPVGRPRRRIEVVREVVTTCRWEGGEQRLADHVTYSLAGDLELFGVEWPDAIPLHAVDDADAAAQADRMVRARWVREGGDGTASDTTRGAADASD